MSQCHDRNRLGMPQPSTAVPNSLCAANRRRWFLAITISAVFHLAMGWSLFEAGVHWPMARCEPVDTRVSPPIDAVTIDLSEPAAQAAEPPGPSAPPVKVTLPATPQAQGST